MAKKKPFTLTKQRLANSNAGKAKHANTDTVNRQDQEPICFGHLNVGIHNFKIIGLMLFTKNEMRG